MSDKRISRIFPIVNAVGCLLLAGFVMFQWGRERDLGVDLHRAKVGLAEARQELAAEQLRAVSLERDIGVLKEAIRSLQEASELASGDLLAKEEEVEGLAAEKDELRGQLKIWEEAVAARDAKLQQLDAALVETRKRLDEAIERLKQAGAR